jgi:hypothetical protein
VISTGVPKIMVVEIKPKISSPNRILKGIATLSADSGPERAGRHLQRRVGRDAHLGRKRAGILA